MATITGWEHCVCADPETDHTDKGTSGYQTNPKRYTNQAIHPPPPPAAASHVAQYYC